MTITLTAAPTTRSHAVSFSAESQAPVSPLLRRRLRSAAQTLWLSSSLPTHATDPTTRRNHDVRASDATRRRSRPDRGARSWLVRRCIRLGGRDLDPSGSRAERDGPAQPAAWPVRRHRLHRQCRQPNRWPRPARGALLRRSGDHQRRIPGRQCRWTVLRLRVHPRRRRNDRRPRRAGHRQPARPSVASRPVPNRRRRTRDRVVHRSGVVPRSVLRRPPRRTGGGDGGVTTSRRRCRLRRTDTEPGMEDASVLGCGWHR